MVARDGTPEQLDAVGQYLERFEDLYSRIADRFVRSEARQRARRYLLGLLGTVERKNGFHEKAIRCQEADVAAVGLGYSSVPVTLSPRFHPHSLMSSSRLGAFWDPSEGRCCNLAVGLL